MFAKVSYTWSMMGESWRVLKQDKELLVFPLFSVIALILVTASFAWPIFRNEELMASLKAQEEAPGVVHYVILFGFYFINYFVMTFFNAAIVDSAAMRMQGGDPTVRSGLKGAIRCLPQIFAWALVAATVGLILRIVEDKSKFVGKIVVGILGIAWSLMTFLVVPVLVLEKIGPIDAAKRSTALLKKTWGEQIVGNFSFGVVFLLLGIPGFLVAAWGVANALWAVVALGVIYLILLGLINSALSVIFQTLVYLHAADRPLAEGVDRNLVEQAMGVK